MCYTEMKCKENGKHNLKSILYKQKKLKQCVSKSNVAAAKNVTYTQEACMEANFCHPNIQSWTKV